jgi:hypothetical protein
MDAAPTPSRPLRLLVEIERSADGRLEGQARTDTTEPWTPFSGVLELLKVLETLLDLDSLASATAPKRPAPEAAPETTPSHQPDVTTDTPAHLSRSTKGT